MSSDLALRIRTLPWRAWVTSPFTLFIIQQLATITLAEVIIHLVSHPELSFLAMSWVVLMTLAHLVGLALQTRWWLSSLVGVVLWQAGMLALCWWSLTTMVAS